MAKDSAVRIEIEMRWDSLDEIHVSFIMVRDSEVSANVSNVTHVVCMHSMQLWPHARVRRKTAKT